MKRTMHLFLIINIFAQTSVFSMHFNRIVKKSKPHTKISGKRSVTTPSNDNALMHKNEHTIIQREKIALSLPAIDHATLQAPIKDNNAPQSTCTRNQKECICIKQYPIMPIQNSDFDSTKKLNWGLIEAKQRLSVAIEVFKDDPYVAAKLIAVQKKLCPQSEQCAKKITFAPTKKQLMKTSTVLGTIFVWALYGIGDPVIASTCTLFATPFITLFLVATEPAPTHHEIKNNSIMQYHIQYENHLINTALKEIEPLLPTLSKPKKI